VDVRLVKGNDPAAMLKKIRTHIEGQGYYVLAGRAPREDERRAHPKVARIDASEGGYRAVRTPIAHPLSQAVIRAVERAHGPIVKMPTLGGSVPLAIIEDVFPVPLVGVPVANHDNNQHSHNENLRLANLWAGVETIAALFRMDR
jgi:acetylornithine deacetylase/succinyl-diaminopimelate desuccinylase-like protein